jgi:hypothetical protein
MVRTLTGCLAALTAACVMTGCGERVRPAAVDRELAACLPAGVIAVAGADLKQVRDAGLFGALPPAEAALADAAPGASYLLVGYTGREVLLAARGEFQQAPPGWVMLGKRVAATGPPALVEAARAQLKTGNSGAEWLMERAEPVAAANAIWAVAQGGARLPLSGNAANLNRLMGFTESAAMGLRLKPGAALEITGEGLSPDDARRFEEALRAFFTLAAFGARRDTELTALLRTADVRRENLSVRATLTAPAGQAGRLLALLSR